MENISLLFTGDVMAHSNQLRAAWDEATQKYDFTRNFSNITKHIKNADIAVCNLETTIAGGEPSGYPRFNSPEALVEAIAQAGFTCVATANNHSFDTGEDGIIETRLAAERHNLKVCGSRTTPREQGYAIVDVRGVKVALLNFTYETPSIRGKRTLNNRPMNDSAKRLLNSFCFETLEVDLEQVRNEIGRARKEGANIVVVYFHWGYEYDRYATVLQKYVAWRTAWMGADAIIGSHAHVMQEKGQFHVCCKGKEKIVPVFYGLGNYVWGSPPVFEQETVLHNILARLDMEYDPKTGWVQVETSYVPMYIGQKDGFEPIDLSSLPEEAYDGFQEKFGIRPDAAMEEIRQTVENELHPAKTEEHFREIFQLFVGQRVSLMDHFLPKERYVKFISEDAVVASVLPNGYVIGNSAGYVGMTAVKRDGTEVQFMVLVLPDKKSKFPVVVNERNRVRDIYFPAGRVKGADYALPEDVMLCLPAAKAWKKMLLNARAEHVHLKAVSGFRTKRDQVTRRGKYAKISSREAALRRYQAAGCSEHHLGMALDVNHAVYEGESTSKEDAFRWIQENSYKYGFVVRPMKSTIDKTVYLHLRYLEDEKLAQFLHENDLTLEKYLTNYEKYTGGSAK